ILPSGRRGLFGKRYGNHRSDGGCPTPSWHAVRAGREGLGRGSTDVACGYTWKAVKSKITQRLAMPLLDQLSKDIVAAMKAKEELRLGALRMIKTALQKETVVDPSKPLTEAQEQQLLKSLVKQRTDSADMFRKGGREDMAVKEEDERAVIEAYLPAAASEDDTNGTLG